MNNISFYLSCAISNLILINSFAEVVRFDIDAEESFLQLKTSLFDGLSFAPGEPQNEDSNFAALKGQVYIEQLGDSLRFLPETRIYVQESGVGFPGPFNGSSDSREFNETPSPAAFAFDFEKPFPLSIAMRYMVFSAFNEMPLGIIDEKFDSSGTTISIVDGLADLTLGLPPQSDLSHYNPVELVDSNNAKLSFEGGMRVLSLPVKFVFQEPGAITVKAEYDGLIKATEITQISKLKQPLNLTGRMDSTSRFYDYFSDAYAEISLDPDGFYQIDNPAKQYGSYDVFVNQTLIDIGKFTVDSNSIAGVGIEVAQITDWNFDITKTVDTTRGETATRVSDIDGSITFFDGEAVNVNLQADLEFEFLSGLVKGFTFPGTIEITNNYFEIHADNTHSTILGPFRNRWELKGSLNLPGLPITPSELILQITYIPVDNIAQITWEADPGASYSLRSTESLTNETWITVKEGIVPESNVGSVDISLDLIQSYFTIIKN
jgi:hypothetical protein